MLSMRPGLRTISLFLFVLLTPRGLPGSAGEAFALDVASCTDCHGDVDIVGRERFVDGDAFLESVHGLLDDCTGCHKDVTEVPHADELRHVGLAECADCHAEVVEDYREGVHGAIATSGIAPGATCSDCHGDPHRIRASSEPESPVHWTRLADTCAHCHANVKMTDTGIPVVRPVEAYLQSVHAAAVAKGERGAVCSDCHGSHRILPAANPDSPIAAPNVLKTCGKCHDKVLAQFERSVHGEAVLRGVRGAPVCTDCHGEHRILGPADVQSTVFSQRIGRETCGQCHANARLAERYGLPRDKVPAFEDSFHGLALRSGQLSVANCASCHGAHDILPSSDPRSHTNPANLPDTCGKCHPGAGERFVIGKVHVVAAESPSRIEYWIRLVYLWLIGIVIGFMALHNGADLVRKARRPDHPSHPPVDVPERMPRVLRWQHGLVMLSFPVLVYTGFALVYPEGWWAQPLLAWETSFGLRGLLHRIAAIILLAALFWHFGNLLVSRISRRRLRGLLWGWGDLRHFGSAIAYYLGLRSEPPPGASFTYIEKAEYWAFLWGMAVMTVTGFVLWFSDAALRYLPKWVTDVATALHFYEAVLATLAILVWHLYWVIFDPEVYPMDWSWWSGKPPASRAIERGTIPKPEAEETGPAGEPSAQPADET